MKIDLNYANLSSSSRAFLVLQDATTDTVSEAFGVNQIIPSPSSPDGMISYIQFTGTQGTAVITFEAMQLTQLKDVNPNAPTFSTAKPVAQLWLPIPLDKPLVIPNIYPVTPLSDALYLRVRLTGAGGGTNISALVVYNTTNQVKPLPTE